MNYFTEVCKGILGAAGSSGDGLAVVWHASGVESEQRFQ